MIPKSDIRQGDRWAKYLEEMGWKSHRTSNGTNIYHTKTFLGSVIKIQRPPLLSEKDLQEIES